MGRKHTHDELNKCSHGELVTMVIAMQDQMDALNENIERLIEQVRAANSYRFGRHTEKLEAIDGQLSFFDEADAIYDDRAAEPAEEEVLPPRSHRKETRCQRETDLKDFPEEVLTPYSISEEELDALYGMGNWKQMPDETYKRLRHEPESWTVEIHTVKVYVGTDGEHQDEFLRGDRPKDLLRGSIVTPSLLSSILNVKYVNSAPLYRIEQEFSRNGVNISRQTMANWIIRNTHKYFAPFWERMKQELLKLHVTQADETPTQVLNDDRSPGSLSYMWVHRSGEFYKQCPIVIYEYQKGRDHRLPLEFYRNYKGILVTDGLSQYHLVDKKLPDVTNANCWAHARRDYADALKAADKKDPAAVRRTVAYQALSRIALIYKLEEALKDISPQERLQERQTSIKPLVEEYFALVKKQLHENAVPPKSKTAEGLHYSVNQEEYLKVFLTDGEIPIDNSASERAIRTFCIGKKNWLFHNSVKGAKASAIIYSISETAKLNDLRPYFYFKHLLTELPKYCDNEGNIDPAKLDDLLPWSEKLPDQCRKPRR